MISQKKHSILPSGFSSVDKLKDPRVLVDYLETINTNPSVRFRKAQVLEALDVRPGDRVIDVGCGVGHMTLELAKMLHGMGHITGIDSSQTMIQEAKKRLQNLRNPPVDYQCEDAHRLSFAEGSFDAGLMMSTLIHVKIPRQVLSELFRVIKPGGRVVAMESDWQLMAFATGNRTADKMLGSIMRRSVRHGGIAHQLPILMKKVGFADISIAAGTLISRDYQSANETWRIHDSVEQSRQSKALSKMQTKLILRALSGAERDGLFFATSVGFVVAGRKPLTHSNQGQI